MRAKILKMLGDKNKRASSGLPKSKKGKKRKELLIGIALLAVSILYLMGSLQLKYGTLKNPGPGLLPIIIGFFLLFCTSLYFIKLYKGEIKNNIEENNSLNGQIKRQRFIMVYGSFACTLAFPFLLEFFKFIGATTIVTFFLLFVLRPQKIFINLGLAFIMAIISFWIFAILFGVAFPFGFLEELFFKWLW